MERKAHLKRAACTRNDPSEAGPNPQKKSGRSAKVGEGGGLGEWEAEQREREKNENCRIKQRGRVSKL